MRTILLVLLVACGPLDSDSDTDEPLAECGVALYQEECCNVDDPVKCVRGWDQGCEEGLRGAWNPAGDASYVWGYQLGWDYCRP